jgi:cytochrome c
LSPARLRNRRKQVSLFLIKSIMATVLLLSGLCAALAMLISMGRVEKKTSPVTLRKVHRASGYIFALLLLGLAIMGTEIFVESGDALSHRAVLHAFLALFLLFLFLLKIALVRFYRTYLRIVPGLGMAVLVLTLVVFSVSAGYFLLRTAFGPDPLPPAGDASLFQGDAKKGSDLFSFHCAGCHHADKEDAKIGPGLKGLFQKGLLPVSGRPATEANIRQQLKEPFRRMPAFGSFSAQEVSELIAYLITL